jgi:predicted  nucleic acid-binding Zn-ribbon protein
MTKQINPYEREAAKAAINALKRELAEVTKQRDALAALAATKGGAMSERALELATALEAELLAQFDKLEATMQRPEFASFPVDERAEIERKHAEISGLLTQADFMKYQISRL